MIKFIETDQSPRHLDEFSVNDIIKCVYGMGSEGAILVVGRNGRGQCLFDERGQPCGSVWHSASYKYLKIGELSL